MSYQAGSPLSTSHLACLPPDSSAPSAPSPPPRSCDNITIAPPLLKELEASTDPLPYQLWPRMVRGGAGKELCCVRGVQR